DRVTGANKLVSHFWLNTSTTGNGEGYDAAISGDGRFVAFTDESTSLVYGFSPIPSVTPNVYEYDRLTGAVTLMSHDKSKATGSGKDSSFQPFVNFDGSVVSYLTLADNIVPGDFNSKQDVMAYVTTPPQVASSKINDGSVQRSTVR